VFLELTVPLWSTGLRSAGGTGHHGGIEGGVHEVWNADLWLPGLVVAQIIRRRLLREHLQEGIIGNALAFGNSTEDLQQKQEQ